MICECLIASEGIDLKFEEAFCSFLLGQVLIFISRVLRYLFFLVALFGSLNLGFSRAIKQRLLKGFSSLNLVQILLHEIWFQGRKLKILPVQTHPW